MGRVQRAVSDSNIGRATAQAPTAGEPCSSGIGPPFILAHQIVWLSLCLWCQRLKLGRRGSSIGITLADQVLGAISAINIGTKFNAAISFGPSRDVCEVYGQWPRQRHIQRLTACDHIIGAARLVPADFIAGNPFDKLEHVLHTYAAG